MGRYIHRLENRAQYLKYTIMRQKMKAKRRIKQMEKGITKFNRKWKSKDDHIEIWKKAKIHIDRLIIMANELKKIPETFHDGIMSTNKERAEKTLEEVKAFKKRLLFNQPQPD